MTCEHHSILTHVSRTQQRYIYMKIRLSPQLSIALLSVPLVPSYGYGSGLLCFGSSAWNIPVQSDGISTLRPKGTEIKGHRANKPAAWMDWGAHGEPRELQHPFLGHHWWGRGSPTGLPADEGPCAERSGGTSVCRSGRRSPIN